MGIVRKFLRREEDIKSFPLPLIDPSVPSIKSWIKILKSPYKSKIFTNGGKLASSAEELMANWNGKDRRGYLCSSNTSGLIVTLIALGAKDKKVALSNFTFPATLQAVFAAGGIPIACDVDPSTWELSVEELEKARKMHPEIKIILHTRVFGFIRNLSELVKYCQNNSLTLIIDSAAAFPVREVKENILNSEVVEVFSLHATKPLGIGEGGLVVGNDENIKKIRKAGNFGLEKSNESFSDGINAKADEFAAARALAAFEKFKSNGKLRQNFARELTEVLEPFKKITLPVRTGDTSWSFYPIKFEHEDQLLEFQGKIKDITLSRRYYRPALFSGYSGNNHLYAVSDLSNSTDVSNTILCLPILPRLSKTIKNEFFSSIKNAPRDEFKIRESKHSDV